ncbi:MAG: XamI family restriction endonuclease [Solirubrobacteraceae bacterium]
MAAPPGSWTEAERRRDAVRAREAFVRERLAARRKERERYVTERDEFAQVVHALLTATDDLAHITGDSLRDRERLNFVRYLAVPPISLDDLDTLTDSVFGSWVKQTTKRGVKPTDDAFKVAATIIGGRIDRDRAPWLAAGRSPTGLERHTFVGWAASGAAAGRVTTLRRGETSHRQEEATRAAVAAARLQDDLVAGNADRSKPANGSGGRMWRPAGSCRTRTWTFRCG